MALNSVMDPETPGIFETDTGDLTFFDDDPMVRIAFGDRSSAEDRSNEIAVSPTSFRAGGIGFVALLVVAAMVVFSR